MIVAVYAICKNEAAVARRFMESIGDANAAFILDTGSTDGTPEILRGLGAVVAEAHYEPWTTLEEYHRLVTEGKNPWRFDRARQAALAMIPANYDVCICLDMDEVLMPGWREALEKAWTSTTTRGRYLFEWDHTGPYPDGRPKQSFHGERIHSRHSVWVGPAHEHLVEVDVSRVDTFIPGLVVRNWGVPGEKRNYLPLLQLGAKEAPGDPWAALYLGRELFYLSIVGGAQNELNRYLALPAATNKQQRSSAMRMLGKLALRMKDYENARIWFERAATEWPVAREVWLDLCDFYNALPTGPDWMGMLYTACRGLRIRANYDSCAMFQDPACWGPRLALHGTAAASRVGNMPDALWYAREAAAADDGSEGPQVKTNVAWCLERLRDRYSTHQEVLVAAVAQYADLQQYFDSPANFVLEVGCGHYSTPMLHGLCAGLGVGLITMENEGSWREMFAKRFAGRNHTFQPICPVGGLRVSVAFVDCETALRAPVTRELLEAGAVVVIHDTEDPRYVLEPVLAAAKYVVQFKDPVTGIETTIASNKVDLMSFVL